MKLASNIILLLDRVNRFLIGGTQRFTNNAIPLSWEDYLAYQYVVFFQVCAAFFLLFSFSFVVLSDAFQTNNMI